MAKKEKKVPQNETETIKEAAVVEEAAEQPETEQTDPLAEAAKKYDELNDRYLRLMAEYENYRKRSSREKIEIYPQATANAVEKFLPIIDNLERARVFECSTEEFAKGFELICQGFADVLKNIGVEEIAEVGVAFDPNLHNAVMHIEDAELGDNVISQILQKGYKIGDKVIRYAMVQSAN